MHISPLLPRLQPHHNPHPDPTKPPPPSPGQEGLFQLHFKLKSSSSTAVEAPCDPLSNSTVQKKKKKQKYTSGVWVLLKYCLTYIIKKVHRFLEQRYPKRGQCVFSCTVWDSEWIHDGSRICFLWAGSAPVSIHFHFKVVNVQFANWDSRADEVGCYWPLLAKIISIHPPLLTCHPASPSP